MNRLFSISGVRLARLAAFATASLAPVVADAQTQNSYTISDPLGAASSACSIVHAIINAALEIGAPIAVLIIVIIGFQFIAAQGKPESIKKAKDNFLYTLIGIGVFFGAWVLAQVLIGTIAAFGVGVTDCTI